MFCCPLEYSAGSATKKWTTTEPADVVALVNDYSSWLAESDIPKLFINAEPGFVVRGPIRELIRTWPNLTETTVSGIQYIQEDSPDEIGTAVAEFVRKNRAR
jgi:haloalkane dehalogenase